MNKNTIFRSAMRVVAVAAFIGAVTTPIMAQAAPSAKPGSRAASRNSTRRAAR